MNNYNKINKPNFLKLNEADVMFITNPGRMGDEDGSTFIIKNKDFFSRLEHVVMKFCNVSH